MNSVVLLATLLDTLISSLVMSFFMGNALSNRVQILFIATIGTLSIIVPVLTQQLKQNQVTPLFEFATHAKQPCCASVNVTLSLWYVFIL